VCEGQSIALADLLFDVLRRTLVPAVGILLIHSRMVLFRRLAAVKDHRDERFELVEGVSRVVHVCRALQGCQSALPSEAKTEGKDINLPSHLSSATAETSNVHLRQRSLAGSRRTARP
jgi:hypothetical protein